MIVTDVLDNTWRVALQNAIDFTNLGLHEQERITPEFKMSYEVGFLGAWPGSLIGIASLVVVLLGRFITNNLKTAQGSFAYVANTMLSDEDYHYYTPYLNNTDKRHPVRQYVLSVVGLVVGAILGAVFALLASLHRATKHSWKTSVNFFQSLNEQSVSQCPGHNFL